jgi:RNAse (barnase) inhibitor barstar
MKKDVSMLPQAVQNAIHSFDLHGKTSIIGSNSIRGNLFGSDYDIEDKLTGSPEQIEKWVHNEFHPSKTLLLEFKIQAGNKKVRFNLDTINRPLAHLIEKCDFMKVDLVVPVGDRFAEISIHYYRNPVKPKITDLEGDVKKYMKTNKMKALKRLFSIYKMEGKNTDALQDFFNSEIGLVIKCVSDLELLNKIKNMISKKSYENNLDYIRSTLATTTAPLVLNVNKLRAIVNKASVEFMNNLT